MDNRQGWQPENTAQNQNRNAGQSPETAQDQAGNRTPDPSGELRSGQNPGQQQYDSDGSVTGQSRNRESGQAGAGGTDQDEADLDEQENADDIDMSVGDQSGRDA